MDPISPVSEPIQPVHPVQPSQPAKNNNSLVIILSILLLIAVGLAGLFYFQIQRLSKELANYQTRPFPTPTATPDVTANWKTYTNSEIGFSFKYPQEWTLQGTSIPRIASFDTKSGIPGEFFVAYHKNIDSLSKWLLDNQAGEIINTINANGNQFSVIKGGTLNVSREYAIKVGTNSYLRLVIEPFPNSVISDEVINQILSTFQFTK